MSAQSEVKKILASVGGEIEEWGTSRVSFIGSIEAPTGYVWKSSDSHSIAVNFHTDRNAAWGFILSEVQSGVRDCDDDECEVCEEIS